MKSIFVFISLLFIFFPIISYAQENQQSGVTITTAVTSLPIVFVSPTPIPFSVPSMIPISTPPPAYTPTPAPANSAPEMIWPQNGQVFPMESSYWLKVKQVAGASGYLFGLFQDGKMIYENYRDTRTLSPNGEFLLDKNSPFHSKFHEGPMQVWVRAYVRNQWTNARVITVILKSGAIVQGPPIEITQPAIATSSSTPIPVPTPTIAPKPSATPVTLPVYYVETLPNSGIVMAAPTPNGQGFTLFALLKWLSGSVVTNQQSLDYSWKVEKFDPNQEINVSPFTACTNGIQEPCPYDHATITVPKVGNTSSANVWVTVTDKSSRSVLAKAEFVLEFVSSSKYVSISNVRPGYNQFESYSINQPVYINWLMINNAITGSNPVDYFNIDYLYYENGLLKGGYIKTVTYPSMSAQWVIPSSLAGKQVKVLVEARKNGLVVGRSYSDWYFNVKNSTPIPSPTPLPASIKVTNPNGGEQITKGQVYRIKWDSAGVDKVLIQSKDEKGSFRGVSGIIANTGYYDWKTQGEYMPSNVSSKQIKIRVIQINSQGRAGIFDESDNYFTMIPKPQPKPDLAVTNMSAITSFVPTPGYLKTTFAFTVKNTGLGNAQPSVTQVSTSNTSSGNKALWMFPTRALVSGASQNFVVAVWQKIGLPYNFVVVADVDKKVDESDEINNVYGYLGKVGYPGPTTLPLPSPTPVISINNNFSAGFGLNSIQPINSTGVNIIQSNQPPAVL